MLKFDFSVQIRGGQRVDNIVIGGRDHADAERKLLQMYRHCEVLSCTVRHPQEKRPRAMLTAGISKPMAK